MTFLTKEDRDLFYKSKEWKFIKENLFNQRGRVCKICDDLYKLARSDDKIDSKNIKQLFKVVK